MDNQPLTEKMRRWRELQLRADALAEEIKSEVMKLRQSVEVPGAVARYSKGRGRYDYESIVSELQPDEEIIARHSTVHIDWRKIVVEVGAPKALLEKHYTPGTPTVSLKLAKTQPASIFA